MADMRDRVDLFFTRYNAWHPSVRVEVEQVRARHVKCEVADCVKSPDVWYARTEGGGHGHLVPFDTPHERLVIRLPAEPVESSDVSV